MEQNKDLASLLIEHGEMVTDRRDVSYYHGRDDEYITRTK